MANLVRSAKSGSDWTYNELLAFNIVVQNADTTAFFTAPDLPVPSVSGTILNSLDMPPGVLPKSDRQFFQYLRAAERASSEEPSVDDFAAFLLRLLDFDSDDRFVRLRKELSFYMSGQRVEAKPDVCLMNDYDYFLLVQGDERAASSDNPEPQLIAESIAAFYQNHLQCERAGVQPLKSQVIRGIIMVGTAPIFYRTVVSESLLDALVTASYPKEQTVVLRFVPPVPSPMRYLSEGMRPLENRCVVFQCLEALKRVIT